VLPPLTLFIALIGMTKWKWDVIPVVLGAGALGAHCIFIL
jgi:hypothetical protein